MSNTQRLGSIWKGRAWDDGEPVPRVTLPDGTIAEAMAAMGYAWNATGSAFQKITVDNADGGLNVHIAGGSTSGTQYTEADTDASITGTAVMWEDTSDTLRSVSAAKPLPVNIVAGAGSGGTAMTDDAAFTPATTSVTPAGAMFDDVAPDSVDEGDGGVLRMSANRNLYTTIRDSAGSERGVSVTAANALKVDASGVAVPVTDNAGSLTVDNGGTFAVQDSEKVADNAAFTDGTTKVLPSGFVFDEVAGTALTENDTAAARIDSKRAQVSVIEDETTRGRRATVTAGNALKVDASAVAVPVTDNAGSLTVDNAGTFVVQDSQVIADDAAFTVATSKVFPSGFLADETSTDSVDEGDVGAARMTLDRKLIVTVEPHAAGGWDVFMASSGDGSTALTSTAQQAKGTAGKLGGWYIYNPNSTAAYVIIYNVASASVTVGTTNPRMVICIPATSAANVEWTNGITFDTAISVAATTTGGGNTAPTTALEANILYK